jgi:TatD DNase family protein
LPLERLLLETDAPYLLPRDLEESPKGRRNAPKYLPWIAARVARLMERPLADVAAAATANAVRLFALEDRALSLRPASQPGGSVPSAARTPR